MVRHLYCIHSLLALLSLAFMLAVPAQAYIDISIVGPGDSISTGTQKLESDMVIRYNEPIPKTSNLYLYVDNESIESGVVSLDTYLHDESYYSYGNLTFGYNFTSSGTVTSYTYPEQDFWYRVTVTGMCGGTFCYDGVTDICDCYPFCSGPNYPCRFTSTMTQPWSGSVDGDPVNTGLKFITDRGTMGTPPSAVPDSLQWSISKEGATPSQVDLAMLSACGGEYYETFSFGDGWIYRSLATSIGECQFVGPNLEDCKVTILPFDDGSMTANYRRFGGPGDYDSGGVYKTVGSSVMEYQSRSIDVDWDGSTGEIILKRYNPSATYIAVYLPPSGSRVCAYTSYSISESEGWSNTVSGGSGSVGYLNPFSRSYTASELDGIVGLGPPACTSCTISGTTYGAEESHDPDDGVVVTDSFDGENLVVSATTGKKILSSMESTQEIELAGFDIDISGMTRTYGPHLLTAKIIDGTTEYKSQDIEIYVCSDGDGDGYCAEAGDCDDTNPAVNPGEVEICNGLDDDCNGVIDDGIAEVGELAGTPCNNWPGSVCSGVYACNTNGTDVVCIPNSGIYPGDDSEYCGNMLDDDCDTAIDEVEGMVINGIPQPACVVSEDPVICIEGQTRPCGACGGISTCTNGVFGSCVGDRAPSTEICNNIDDDCDGVVDNIPGKSSVQDSKCGCYGGAPSSSESCNNIDDDCNGRIDDGITGCCRDGDAMTCGYDTGACEFGIQRCENGMWGACTGQVGPEPSDICCNNIDDDCNGIVDDYCTDSDCVVNGEDYSFIFTAMIAIGVLLLVGVLVISTMKKHPRVR